MGRSTTVLQPTPVLRHRPRAKRRPTDYNRRMTWIAYTDGACAPTNPGPCAWGLYLIPPGAAEGAEHYGFIGHGTNQIAELTAAIEGLSRVPDGAAVELVSDSQYVLKGLTEWRKGWERRGFRNAEGKPVSNLGLWQRLFALADARTLQVRWVRGHNGDLHNERVDGLANKALREAREGGIAKPSEARPPAGSQGALF